MLEKFDWENSRTATFLQAVLILVVLFWLASAAFGQNPETKPVEMKTQTDMQKTETPKPVMMPVLEHYKEVKIGMTADEVRDKLGKAKIDDKDGFFYQIDDDEMAQIRLGKNKKVRLIAITYLKDNKNAPQFADVFGADVVAESQADGSVYKRVRYPEVGYWITYSRTAGDKPIVTITMQKF